MRLLFLWILPALCAALPVMAQEAAPATQGPPTEQHTLRHFDEQRIATLRDDPAYAYERDLRRMPSPWERFKAWLAEWLGRILNTRIADFVARNLLYIFIAVALVFALMMLMRGGLRGVFHGAPRGLGQVSVSDEDIRGMDLEAMIRDAEAKGDLRLAIRLHYLLVLRRLVDQGVLHWAPEYTDRDYREQIGDAALRARFAKAASVFQWVWYGHAPVAAEAYARLRDPFLRFHPDHT